MSTVTATPEIRTNGDKWIAHELEQIRLQARLLGGLPAFRRDVMHFDFDAGKVRVASAIGGAA